MARLGVRDYVTKPFNEELLLAKAGRAVPLVARPTHNERPESALGRIQRYPRGSELRGNEIPRLNLRGSPRTFGIRVAESLRAGGG